METVNCIDQNMFANMILNAAAKLNAEKAGVDSLNVFPVPDGDTGNKYVAYDEFGGEIRQSFGG